MSWIDAVDKYRTHIECGMGRKRLKDATGYSWRRCKTIIDIVKGKAPDPRTGRLHPPQKTQKPPQQQAQGGQRHAKVENEGNGDRRTVNVKAQALVMNIEDLVEVADIDLDDWHITRHRVNTWTVTIKGNDGEPQVVRNWQVRAELERRFDKDVLEPKWLPVPRVDSGEKAAVECALIIPDSQHGFRWNEDRSRLEPLHDRRACDIAVQIAKDLQPNYISLLGDMLDVAEWSTKFPRPAELRDTTQPSIRELHWWLRDLRTVCPSAVMDFLEGNHEFRIQRALTEAMPHAANLTAVGDELPVLAIARLLGLDALDINYHGPYGASYYLWDHVRVTHGDKVRAKGGATTQAVVGEATEPTLFGHVHRTEYAAKTIHERRGPRVIWAATPGCLCRVDGAVPGVTIRPDWQQGLGIVYWDGEVASYEPIAIENGRACWRGKIYEGVDRGDEIAEATGWKQVA